MKMLAVKPTRVRAAILRFFGWEPSLLSDSAADAPNGLGAITVQQMLGLSAVWACVRLISETIATLPLAIYENTRTGKRVAPSHPLHFILHDQPNADTTASVFWEAVVAAMLLRGAARVEKLMLSGRVVGLEFLHPDRLTRQWTPNGCEWRYANPDGTQRVIPDAHVWSVPGFSLDGKSGVSVIAHGAGVFGAALAAERAAANTYSNGLHRTTAWTYPNGVLKPDQREEARVAIGLLSGAVNAGKPVILEAGMSVQEIGINPADAQLLESRAFSVEEICRWFRVPPFMVGHSEKSTSWGTGIEQQMIGFLTFTLGPWLRRLEQAIRKDLMAPGDRVRFYPKFAVEGLLRADSAARASFYSVMVNNGMLTRDEVRELEDRDPMGGNAGVLTVQTALAPLDQIGRADDANAVKAALQSWLKEPKEQSDDD